MKKQSRSTVKIEQEPDVLQQVLSRYAPDADKPSNAPVERMIVGECVDERHPTLIGRVQVRWTDESRAERTQWLPTLKDLTLRVGDRVLVQQPVNFEEPIVLGIVSGFTRRIESIPAGPKLELPRDEAVHVLTSDGKPLLRIRETDSGPQVQLLSDDVDLTVPGKLRMAAGQIELAAQAGNVKIEATGDVNVTGEIINLN